jgi:hypothetical protein
MQNPIVVDLTYTDSYSLMDEVFPNRLKETEPLRGYYVMKVMRVLPF